MKATIDLNESDLRAVLQNGTMPFGRVEGVRVTSPPGKPVTLQLTVTADLPCYVADDAEGDERFPPRRGYDES